jgi:formylglycine-generating enzyme required for sulfatase activity
MGKSKWVRLLFVASINSTISNVSADNNVKEGISWPEQFSNPSPLPGDIEIPMPCGGKMVFRVVAVPAANILDDKQVRLGDTDIRRGYTEGQRVEYVGAGLNRNASIRQPFYLIGKYEVNRAQYRALKEPCRLPSPDDRLPITGVTWAEAVEFTGLYTSWLARHKRDALPRDGGQPAFVRLPTEAEWEYAARGGNAVSLEKFEQPVFDMPDGIGRYVWFAGTESSNNELNSVGLLRPNPLGIHDILGNAGEFVLDPFRLHKHSRLHGQAGGFIVKGGDFRTPPAEIRASSRSEYVPISISGERRDQATGFRIVVVGPSIPSKDRLQGLRDAWISLARTSTVARHSLPDPISEIEALAQLIDDPSIKRRIEGVGAAMKSNIQARNEQRERSARSEIRVAAYLGMKIIEDRAKIRALRSIIAGPLPENFKVGHRDNLRSSEVALEGTVEYMLETVKQIGRDYPTDTLAAQAKILAQEFENRKAPLEYQALISLVERTGSSISEGKLINRDSVISELEKLEKIRKP